MKPLDRMAAIARLQGIETEASEFVYRLIQNDIDPKVQMESSLQSMDRLEERFNKLKKIFEQYREGSLDVPSEDSPKNEDNKSDPPPVVP